MRKWLLGLSIAVFGGMMVVADVEAKRFGGGRSSGAQRNVTAPPAQTPAKPAQQAGQQTPQAAPAAAQPSRWGMLGGILGGLALGGLLGYLFGGNGLLGLLMLALLAIGAVFLVRAMMRRRAEQQPVQFAGTNERMVLNSPLAQASGGPVASSGPQVPASFDTAGFLRAAKLNFIKLQVANDSGRLDEIREFTTPELFNELRTDIQASGQQTDVVTLNADLLELASEKQNYWASVRFSGLVRETPGTEPQAFEEVWNLVKPADGSSGWLLAGIQQMH
ncbi:MAG TPA: TIM44-like domain-containing protein [Burkholderiales bacterium]|nr:TIM44-like domain-containing protein [Burkholderiales bacterium]